MNDQQIFLVRSSFEKVAPYADTAACLFYYRLFDVEPSMRSMFPTTLTDQGRQLMHMLTLAVGKLDRLDQLIPIAEGFGRRLAGRDMRLEHYDAVATALRWTLEQVLGDGFTPEVEDAWLDAFTLLATTMQHATSLELETAVAL